MTPRQMEVFSWVVAFVDRHGYSPTVREMGARFNWSSPNAGQLYLKLFQKEGWVTAANGSGRAWTITAAGRRAAR